MTGDAPRRRVPAALHGAALAVWSVGIAWAYSHFASRGFGLFGTRAVDGYLGLLPLLWRQTAERLGWPALGEPGLALAAAACAGAAAGALLRVLHDAMRLDPERKSRDALWWPLRRVRGFWGAALGLPVVLGALLRGYDRLQWPDWLVLPLGLAIGAWYLALPFGALQRTVLQSADGAGWWRPRWAGVAVVATYVVLELLRLALDVVPAWLGGDAGLVDVLVGVPVGACDGSVGCALVLLAGDVLLWLLALAIGIATVRALVERMTLATLARTWRAVVDRRLLGAFVALEVRGVALGCWLVAPILVGAYFSIYDLPQLGVLYRAEHERALPWWLAGAATGVELMLSYWWILLVLPVGVHGYLATGRLYADLVMAETRAPAAG